MKVSLTIMGTIRGTLFFRSWIPAVVALVLLSASIVSVPIAAAQDAGKNNPPASKPLADDDYLGKIGRWFDEQAAKFKSNFNDAKSKVDNFGHEAGIAAKTTVDTAKEAADAVARIPNARVVRGHEKCVLAANGAPDCVAAANAVCKTQGFSSGKSVDMTTAEDCPANVLISGRSAGTNECSTVTFVSRALCQ
jgi:hypothetical protein